MNTRRINGFLFEKMLCNGLANLRRQEETLNRLNVFPVADGDTGTNMRMTLENGLRNARGCEVLGTYLHALNDGLLLGARGNSGVILSQIFRGMYLHLARCAAANVGDMRNALIQGYKTAYRAVVRPVEGTILTVSREGIEHIRGQINRSTSMETLFSMYLAEMNKSLAQTPHLLPVLKASGVVDSGALGYITLVEGMCRYLHGEVLPLDEEIKPTQAPADMAPPTASLAAFNEHSAFEKGYCMEFILQLMASPAYSQGFVLEDFVREIEPFGDSIAVTHDNTRVKVHIHTKKPAFILSLGQRYGEFLTFKLDNMQLQHNQQMNRQRAAADHRKKPLGLIAVASGEGMKEEFSKLGCDVVLDGGITMNTPSSDFLAAYEEMDAEHIVVLANSKNVLGAAEQAITLCHRGNIHIIPTRSVAEGYFAAAMDIGNSPDTQKRMDIIRKGAEGVVTLSVARAEKPYADETVSCVPGDYIAVLCDRVVFAAKTPEEAFLGGLSHIDDIEDRETCLIFTGEASGEAAEEALADRLGDAYPSLETSFLPGGQHTYLWIGGVI